MTDPTRPDDDISQSEPTPTSPATVDAKEKETRTWAMFIHFSVLASWIVPLAGIIVPIVLWQMKKDELPGIVPHAHIVMNWIITSLVYGFICFILTFLVIGIFGFVMDRTLLAIEARATQWQERR